MDRLVLSLSAALFVCAVATSAYASPEEQMYYDGASTGSSGWDLGYGPDDDLDEDLTLERQRREAELREQQEEQERRRVRDNDFFNQKVDVYDEDLSRTDPLEQKRRTTE